MNLFRMLSSMLYKALNYFYYYLSVHCILTTTISKYEMKIILALLDLEAIKSIKW